MFKLDAAPTFEACVTLVKPGGEETTIRASFAYRDQKAYAALIDEMRGKPVAAFINQLLLDWDLEDDPQGRWEGMPCQISLAALEDLANRYPRAMGAFLDVYLHETLGLPLKN